LADYTITTTARQDFVLTKIVEQVNAERGTTFTIAQFLQAKFPDFLKPYELRLREEFAKEVQLKYAAADDATQAQVRTILGVS
jgi:hypothetical protein